MVSVNQKRLRLFHIRVISKLEVLLRIERPHHPVLF